MRVLMVEDCPDSAQAIVDALGQRHEVVRAEDGMRALGALTDLGPFDALLLDENLPGYVRTPTQLTAEGARERVPYTLEGSQLLGLVMLLRDRPRVIVAMSGIKQNNDRLCLLGATHRADGKDPEAIRRILDGDPPPRCFSSRSCNCGAAKEGM